MQSAQSVLRTAKTIMLVDWVTPELPRTLIEAGINVTSYDTRNNTARSLTIASNESAIPEGMSRDDIFRPGDGQTGIMLSLPLPEPSKHVDLVCVSRLAEEAPEIARLAVTMGARALWLQSGIRSEEARNICEAAGLGFIDDSCIIGAVKEFRPH